MTQVAVLGLGRMGAAIAERLANAGTSLAVWNRSPAATQQLVQGCIAAGMGDLDLSALVPRLGAGDAGTARRTWPASVTVTPLVQRHLTSRSV